MFKEKNIIEYAEGDTTCTIRTNIDGKNIFNINKQDCKIITEYLKQNSIQTDEEQCSYYMNDYKMINFLNTVKKIKPSGIDTEQINRLIEKIRKEC